MKCDSNFTQAKCLCQKILRSENFMLKTFKWITKITTELKFKLHAINCIVVPEKQDGLLCTTSTLLAKMSLRDDTLFENF